MNPLDVVLNELNSDGMCVEVKRQCSDGSLVQTRTNELATLGTQARIANTAKLVAKLMPDEKLSWALEMKEHGNEFYRSQKYGEAMSTYVEALIATDFSSGKESAANNIDILVVPVLCNLAACCLQLAEWNKAVQFSQQAISLRSNCVKAHMRRGIALLKLREFDQALNSFIICETAHNTGDEGSKTENLYSLSLGDQKKVSALLRQARLGVQEDRLQLRRQKSALRKAFNAAPERPNTNPLLVPAPPLSIAVPATKRELMSLTELLLFFVEFLLRALGGLWRRLIKSKSVK